MRRLVLTADISLDGFLVEPLDGDEELARYRRRIVQKAGVHARGAEWTVEAITEALSDGGDEELAPVVAEGGPAFCRELVRRGLVDEYRLMLHSVALGEGERLFTSAVRLLDLSTRHFAAGILARTLVPEDRYVDRPPPYPWSASGSTSGSTSASCGAQGEAQDDHDAQPEDAAESPAEG